MVERVRSQMSAGSEVNRRRARTFAAELRPLMLDLRAQGHTFACIADLLNRQGVQTRRGVRWTGENVRATMNLPLG